MNSIQSGDVRIAYHHRTWAAIKTLCLAFRNSYQILSIRFFRGDLSLNMILYFRTYEGGGSTFCKERKRKGKEQYDWYVTHTIWHLLLHSIWHLTRHFIWHTAHSGILSGIPNWQRFQHSIWHSIWYAHICTNIYIYIYAYTHTLDKIGSLNRSIRNWVL